jgi:hypothetical protein
MLPALRDIWSRFLIAWIALLPVALIWPDVFFPVGSWAWPWAASAVVLALASFPVQWVAQRLFP